MMKFTHLRTPLLGLMTAAILSACGGGGGNVATSNPVDGGNSGNNGSGNTGTVNTGSIALFAGNVGGSGTADGAGAYARFNVLSGIAVDGSGNVYVGDYGRVRKITQAGVVTTFAGGTSAGGTGSSGRLFKFDHMVTDTAGNIYVLDYGCKILKLTPSAVSSTLAGNACDSPVDGPGNTARFNMLNGLAIDKAGNLYVSDEQTVRKVTPAGVVTTMAGQFRVTGSEDGAGANAHFHWPGDLAVDDAGNVYVPDKYNHVIRKITAAGVVSTIAGRAGETGSLDGVGSAARFQEPRAVALDAAGNLYVADSLNSVIRKITPAGVVSTIAGVAGLTGPEDGTGSSARFDTPESIASDSAGNLYVADTKNFKVRKISPAGVVTTLAGSSIVWGMADGNGAVANFNAPANLIADSGGNLFLSDGIALRKISAAGIVTTVLNSAANFNQIHGLTIDASGNVYVADTIGTVSQVSPAGVITQLAGTFDRYGLVNGSGSSVRFNSPNGIVTTSNGDMLIADIANKTIRKMTIAGLVDTFASVPLGQAVYFSNPASVRLTPLVSNGMAMDGSGNLYVADGGNHVIFKISSAGVSSVFAGASGQAGSADGSGAAARFNRPQGLSIDTKGNLYVADTDNHTVRKITPAGLVSTLIGVAGQEGFTPGTLPGALSKPQSVVFSVDALYVTTYHGVVVARNF